MQGESKAIDASNTSNYVGHSEQTLAISGVFSFLLFGERVTFAKSPPVWSRYSKQEDDNWAKTIIGGAPVHAIDFILGECQVADELVALIWDASCGAENLLELKLTHCLGVCGCDICG